MTITRTHGARALLNAVRLSPSWTLDRKWWVAWLAALAIVAVAAVATTLRLAEEAGDRSLDHVIETAEISERSLRTVIVDSFPPGPATDPLGPLVSALADAKTTLPTALADDLGPAEVVYTTAGFTVLAIGEDPPDLPTTVTMQSRPNLDELITTVAGRASAPTGESIEGAAVIEVGVPVTTAAQLGLEVGDELLIGPDFSDLTASRFGPYTEPLVLRVTELVELVPEQDPVWFGDTRLHRPTTRDTALGGEIAFVATLRPEQVPTLPLTTSEAAVIAEARSDFVAPDLSAEQVDELLGELRRVEASAPSAVTAAGTPRFSTGLGTLLTEDVAGRRLVRSLAAVAAAFVAVGALLATAMVAAAGNASRLGETIVLRSRGASLSQIAALSIVGLIALGASAAIGILIAIAAVPGPVERGLSPAMFTAGGIAIVVVVTTLSNARAPLSRLRRPPRIVSRSGTVRLVAEGAIVILAIVSLMTIRDRPIDPAERAIDPLVVVAMLSLVAAAGIIGVRLVSAGSRWSAGTLARPGGVSLLVGLRRLGVTGVTATVLVVTLILASGVVAFTAVLIGATDRARTDASWAEAQAPYRIDLALGAHLTAAELRALPGVTAASTHGTISTTFTTADGTVPGMLVVVEADQYQAILDEGGSAVRIPSEVRVQGEAGASVPVIATGAFADPDQPAGGAIEALVAGSVVQFDVVSTEASILGSDEAALIADAGQLESISGVTIRPDAVYVAADSAAAPHLAEAAAADGLTLISQEAVLADLSDRPLAEGSRSVLIAASAGATAIAAITLLAFLVLVGLSRARQIGILDVVGALRGSQRRALAAETVPLVLVALLLAGWLATAALRAMVDRIDLGPLVGVAGPSITVPSSLAWWTTGIGFALALTLVFIVVSRMVRTSDPLVLDEEDDR